MPPAIEAGDVARPFAAVLTSNVPGDYPPDQWADVTTRQILTVKESASDERARKTARCQAAIRAILIAAFGAQQQEEQHRLGERGCARYDDDLGIDRRVLETSARIIAAAREHLVFGPQNLGDLYAENRAMLCAIIGTNLATSVTITRKWHAHARS